MPKKSVWNNRNIVKYLKDINVFSFAANKNNFFVVPERTGKRISGYYFFKKYWFVNGKMIFLKEHSEINE